MASTEPSSANAADSIVSDDDEIDYNKKPEFFDPLSDDKDEVWMQRRRKGSQSDALLSCPACFTTLCIDCQRHEKYVTQYRAMFVLNCKVVFNQRLRLPADSKKKREVRIKSREQYNRNNSSSTETVNESLKDEIFKSVCCSVCQTEVAVLDEDDIYHFFNVIPSYA